MTRPSDKYRSGAEILGGVVDLTRRVSAHLVLDAHQSLAMVLKVAVSDMPGAGLAETLHQVETFIDDPDGWSAANA